MHFTSTGLLLVGEVRMAQGPSTSALGRPLPGRLAVYEPDTATLRGHVDVGVLPLTITSTPDGQQAYVAAVASSTVTIVDLTAMRVFQTITVDRRCEPGAHGLAYLPARPA